MVPFTAGAEDIDFDLLAVYLKALSNPGRLELLWRLRFPSSAADVAVRPRRKDALSPERAMSRQTISEHLAQLEEAGVVRRVPHPDGGADQWVTDVPHVFALLEELRKLTAIPSAPLADLEETTARAAEKSDEWMAGPKLVLLSGPWEGRVFPLAGPGPWTLGRSRSRSIPLTYDPFVSAEHAELARAKSGFEFRAGPESRNPSRVNFAAIDSGKRRALRHGDLISVGRSLLLFHAE